MHTSGSVGLGASTKLPGVRVEPFSVSTAGRVLVEEGLCMGGVNSAGSSIRGVEAFSLWTSVRVLAKEGRCMGGGNSACPQLPLFEAF